MEVDLSRASKGVGSWTVTTKTSGIGFPKTTCQHVMDGEAPRKFNTIKLGMAYAAQLAAGEAETETETDEEEPPKRQRVKVNTPS